eukprot:SAG11_NODE_9080_length_946_cov_1.342385_2_plen_69_part_01
MCFKYVRCSSPPQRRALAALAAALASHPSLTELRLAATRLGDQAAATLARALSANCRLSRLDLGSNALG